MFEQKVVLVESEYDANVKIEKFNKDGWKVSQITCARSNYTANLWILFEKENEDKLIND